MLLLSTQNAPKRRAIAVAASLTGTLALLAGGSAAAQVSQVVEVAQVAQNQLAQLAPALDVRDGYDWSVLIAAGFGLLGLYWIRRHINRL